MSVIAKTALFLALTLIVLTSCSPAVQHPVSLMNLQESHESDARDYRIHSGDQLEIKFFYNSELNEVVSVRPDGRISLQLVNEIKVAGLTPVELRDQLKSLYAKDIDKPEIAVIVRTFSSNHVFVDGEVGKPGLVPLTELTTALQAISQAGGMKETARRDEIIVIRRGQGNSVVSTMLNLELALDGTDVNQNIQLASNDIVYVPRSHISNVNLWVDQYIRKMLPITPGFAVVP